MTRGVAGTTGGAVGGTVRLLPAQPVPSRQRQHGYARTSIVTCPCPWPWPCIGTWHHTRHLFPLNPDEHVAHSLLHAGNPACCLPNSVTVLTAALERGWGFVTGWHSDNEKLYGHNPTIGALPCAEHGLSNCVTVRLEAHLVHGVMGPIQRQRTRALCKPCAVVKHNSPKVREEC